MNLDNAIVEVVECADRPGLLLRVCLVEEPRRVLDALDFAEDLIDEPVKLGDWAEASNGMSRGLALLARRSDGR